MRTQQSVFHLMVFRGFERLLTNSLLLRYGLLVALLVAALRGHVWLWLYVGGPATISSQLPSRV